MATHNASANRIAAMPAWKRAVLLGMVAVILLSALFVCAELAVRARMYVKYGTFWGFQLKEFDPNTGLNTPKPNYVSGPVRINSLGFRGPDIAEPKPTGTVRLAFLGGSTTFCQEVSSNEMVWANLLTESLRTEFPNTQIDFINAAVTAFTVNQSTKNLQTRVAKHSPDVLFIYHAVNDIGVNGSQLASRHGKTLSTKPRNPAFQWLIETSLLAELVHKNLLIVFQQQKAAEIDQKIPFDRDFMTSAFRQDLTRLVDEGLKTARFVVIPTFSNRLRRSQGQEERLEAAKTHLFHIPYFSIADLLVAFESYNDVIREFASRERVIVVETADAIPGTSTFFVDSVHFSDRGSQAIADHLSSVLVKSTELRALLVRSG